MVKSVLNWKKGPIIIRLGRAPNSSVGVWLAIDLGGSHYVERKWVLEVESGLESNLTSYR